MSTNIEASGTNCVRRTSSTSPTRALKVSDSRSNSPPQWESYGARNARPNTAAGDGSRGNIRIAGCWRVGQRHPVASLLSAPQLLRYCIGRTEGVGANDVGIRARIACRTRPGIMHKIRQRTEPIGPHAATNELWYRLDTALFGAGRADGSEGATRVVVEDTRRASKSAHVTLADDPGSAGVVGLDGEMRERERRATGHTEAPDFVCAERYRNGYRKRSRTRSRIDTSKSLGALDPIEPRFRNPVRLGSLS